jgi:hypothetical protein
LEGIQVSAQKKTARQILANDIEPPVPPEQPVQQMVQERQPHDSAYVYSALKFKHTKKVIPTLDTTENKGKGKALILAMLVGLSVFGGWGVAYEVQVLITPHVAGTCAAPAVIQSGGCFIAQTSTDAQGNSHTVLIPAGHLNP